MAEGRQGGNPDGWRIEEWLNDDCGFFIRATEKLEDFQSDYQHVQVFDTPEYGRLFLLDGAFMTSERDEFFYHENLVHPAAIAHPGPQTALVIGGGDGGSVEELLKHPTMRSVTMAELDPAVVEISRRHLPAVHRGVLDDPRLTIRIGDGLAFVRESTERYDLIVLDLTDPGTVASPLYTEAFYRHCAARLNPGGALTLHVGSPVAHRAWFNRNIAVLRQVFARVRPYLVAIPLYGSWWGMACASESLEPLTLGSDEVEARLQQRGIADLQFYNGDMHRAVFALPNFVRKMLER